jgi:hypothetical protein
MGRLEYDQMYRLPQSTPQGTRLGWKILRWSAYFTIATIVSAGLMFLLMSGNTTGP